MKEQYPIIKQFIDKHKARLSLREVITSGVENSYSFVRYKVNNRGYGQIIANQVAIKVEMRPDMESSAIIRPVFKEGKLTRIGKLSTLDERTKNFEVDVDRLGEGTLELRFEGQLGVYFSLRVYKVSIIYNGVNILEDDSEDARIGFDQEVMLLTSQATKTSQGRIYIAAVIIIFVFCLVTLCPKFIRLVCMDQQKEHPNLSNLKKKGPAPVVQMSENNDTDINRDMRSDSDEQ